MKLPFLVTGLILIFVASCLMAYGGMPQHDGFANCDRKREGFANCDRKREGFANCNRKNMTESFTSYFLNEAGGTGGNYQPMGAFDGVKLVPNNGISQYRNTLPNEPLMGPAFEVGPDSLFMFKNNQCKPECCGASFACDGGCVCSTPEQRKMINMRGGNRSVEDGF